jgi:hypothetical protein
MSSVDYHYPAERTVRFLNAAPLIDALRFQPEDFELKNGWLNHAPSRHRFQFERSGKVTIEANCSCAAMSIKPEQKEDLISMFNTWRTEYWAPLETNREFASHFAKPNAWVRLFRDIRMAFRRFIRREESAGLPADALVSARVTPAE